MQRFFVPPSAIDGGTVAFSAAQARQMATVLRLHPGDTVVALDGSGTAYQVVLREVGPKGAAAEVMERWQAGGEPATRITLYQGIPRSQRWEVVLQKGTETGIAAFVPVRCRRSVTPGETGPDRAARWRQIVQEAAEQCGRGVLPEVRPSLTFDAACAAPAALRLLLHPTATAQPLRLAAALAGRGSLVALYVGPEGGFDDAEVRVALDRGILPVHLGARVLRTETAGPLASALLLQELDDLGAPAASPEAR